MSKAQDELRARHDAAAIAKVEGQVESHWRVRPLVAPGKKGRKPVHNQNLLTAEYVDGLMAAKRTRLEIYFQGLALPLVAGGIGFDPTRRFAWLVVKRGQTCFDNPRGGNRGVLTELGRWAYELGASRAVEARDIATNEYHAQRAKLGQQWEAGGKKGRRPRVNTRAIETWLRQERMQLTGRKKPKRNLDALTKRFATIADEYKELHGAEAAEDIRAALEAVLKVWDYR